MSEDEWRLDDCPDCGQRLGHDSSCQLYEASLYTARVRGFVPNDSATWICRRGCGTVVWDIEAHIKNVCKEFNPVVGES